MLLVTKENSKNNDLKKVSNTNPIFHWLNTLQPTVLFWILLLLYIYIYIYIYIYNNSTNQNIGLFSILGFIYIYI